MHLASLLLTLSTSNKCNHFESMLSRGRGFCFLVLFFVFVSFSSIRTTLFIVVQERRVYVWSEEKGFESHEL